MRSKTVLIALFVLSIFVLGGILWRGISVAPAVNASTPATTMLLVAAHPLGTGTLLRGEDLQWAAWSDIKLPGGAITRPKDDAPGSKSSAGQQLLAGVSGAVLRVRVDAGEPIVSDAIVKPGDRGFLAAVLVPGHRAISISVGRDTGGAGLIFPGDHVDLILTQSFKQGEEPLGRRSVGETIVQDLRVLAIDQRLQQISASPNESKAEVPRTVTLEVLPKEAEMIDVAAELGKLSLILRSVPSDPEAQSSSVQTAVEAARSTWAADVSPALKPQQRAVEKSARAPVVEIMRGSKTDNGKN